MMVGYTLHMQKLNKAADSKNIGVRLGRFCIKNDISVAEIAAQLGVTRQAVYNWFVGKSTPNKTIREQIAGSFPV